MKNLRDATYAGQAIYSPFTLAFYDLVVLGLSNSLVWLCPMRRILQLYDRHISVSHLDVGVGTGWYLDHCHFPSAAPRVGLWAQLSSALSARLANSVPNPRALKRGRGKKSSQVIGNY
jgi:hypothetical protein